MYNDPSKLCSFLCQNYLQEQASDDKGTSICKNVMVVFSFHHSITWRGTLQELQTVRTYLLLKLVQVKCVTSSRVYILIECI